MYDGKDKDPKELVHVSKLHEDKIEDILYLKNEEQKYLVSCSMDPFPALKVSTVSKNGSEVNVIS